MANTIAIGSKVCGHQRWRIRKSALQSRGGERSLKARRPCFVPPGHVAPTAFSDMTHSCALNSVRTATAVIEYGQKCHISGLLFPKSAKNSHSSTTPYALSAILGRNPGRQTIFALFIREHGRIPGQAIHLGSISVQKRPRCLEKRCKISILSTAYP